MTMEDFKVRFAHYNPNTDTYTFNNARTGVIVALVRSIFSFPYRKAISRSVYFKQNADNNNRSVLVVLLAPYLRLPCRKRLGGNIPWSSGP